MAEPAGRGDPSHVPEELDRLADRLDRLSRALVLLEERPLEAVRFEVRRFSDALAEHCSRPASSSAASADPAGRRLLEEEHRRFLGSVEQLRVLLGVVSHDDHGGHRQALGQYGRLVVESLRRHRADEIRHGPGPR